MNKDLSSNQIDNEEIHFSSGDVEYINLITKLQEIKSIITLLEKSIQINFKFTKSSSNKKFISLKRQPLVFLIFSSISFLLILLRLIFLQLLNYESLKNVR